MPGGRSTSDVSVVLYQASIGSSVCKAELCNLKDDYDSTHKRIIHHRIVVTHCGQPEHTQTYQSRRRARSRAP